MTGTGRLTRERTRGLVRTRLRRHVAALVLVGIIFAGLLAASLLGAPLVSVLLAGILLVCPLLMWVPFRSERTAHADQGSRGRDGLR